MIRETTPTRAETFATLSKARADADETSATAIPEAVIRVFVTSAYIALLASVV
jgi:hypothetical protein